MSDFIETLRSLGGVKPCPCFTLEGSGDIISCTPVSYCQDCHGTGQILDLAPLLAKPKMLEMQVGRLLNSDAVLDAERKQSGKDYNGWDGVTVVGPQRAQPVVQEVARQLGGTAVVVKPVIGITTKEFNPGDELKLDII